MHALLISDKVFVPICLTEAQERSHADAAEHKMGVRVVRLAALCTLYATVAAASHHVPVGGFARQQLTGASEQVAESDGVPISMHCNASDGGHRITIRANSAERENKTCESRCYFATSDGLAGIFYASGIVPASVHDMPFRTDYFGQVTITITHPGSFACH